MNKFADDYIFSYAQTRNIFLSILEESSQYAIQAYLEKPQISHNISILKLFDDFAQKECATSGRARRELVSPSGRFCGTAKLGIFAHYPTFRSKFLENGETSDVTNPCMRMLLRVGLDTGRNDIDQWELWHRRESTKDRKRHEAPWQSASLEEIELQTQFSKQCLDVSKPKVVLLLGKLVERAFQRMISAKSTISVVNAGGLPVYLVWEANALIFLAVGCPHPETVFYDESAKYGLLIDAAIELAVSLAGFRDLKVDNTYFQRKTSLVQPKIKRTETMWSLGPSDSRVMMICRLRKWEKENNQLIRYEQIPIAIMESYAEKIGIFDNLEQSEVELLQGRIGFVEAILASYTEASHHICSEKRFENLVKANEAQKISGYQASIKARDNRIAEADARNIARGRAPLKRKSFVCSACSRILLSRQGLHEHMRIEHQGFRYRCKVVGCEKKFRSSSGMRDHKKKKHRSLHS